MAEYIDKDLAIAFVKGCYCKGCDNYRGIRCRACQIMDALDAVDDFPASDVVEVVRCRDCIHSDEMEAHGVEAYRLCKIMGKSVKPDFFCADGRNGNE